MALVIFILGALVLYFGLRQHDLQHHTPRIFIHTPSSGALSLQETAFSKSAADVVDPDEVVILGYVVGKMIGVIVPGVTTFVTMPIDANGRFLATSTVTSSGGATVKFHGFVDDDGVHLNLSITDPDQSTAVKSRYVLLSHRPFDEVILRMMSLV
jgi:hypothetical protein